VVTGCGRVEGEFAIRRGDSDVYRKAEGVPEFSVDESADWAFVAPRVSGSHIVGVALMKKELVWVDVHVRNETLDPTRGTIYGKVENLEKGDYKILLAEKGKKIAEMEFIVYDDSAAPEEEDL
jgi:hypothetical protein